MVHLTYDQIEEKIKDLRFEMSKIGDKKLEAEENNNKKLENMYWSDIQEIELKITELETLQWYERNNSLDR